MGRLGRDLPVCRPARFARLGREVWGLSGQDEAAARAAIQATVDYFRALGMPTCFSELGIGVQDEATLQEMADCVTYHGARTIGTFRVMGREEILAAYRLANR